MADNDAALGMIVEAVQDWPQTAIFVLEDDTQNGPGQLIRTVLLLLSCRPIHGAMASLTAR